MRWRIGDGVSPVGTHSISSGAAAPQGKRAPEKKGVSKYNVYLEKDANLARRRNNLKRGSGYTADLYFRRLCIFCLKQRLTPDGIRSTQTFLGYL
ncbi:MAG: hypothetical protein ACYC7D_15830 [Nitrososphaerales archaeon]